MPLSPRRPYRARFDFSSSFNSQRSLKEERFASWAMSIGLPNGADDSIQPTATLTSVYRSHWRRRRRLLLLHVVPFVRSLLSCIWPQSLVISSPQNPFDLSLSDGEIYSHASNQTHLFSLFLMYPPRLLYILPVV